MIRPEPGELVRLSVAAQLARPDAEELIQALTDFLHLTGHFVRAGRSAAVMCETFDRGVAALRQAAGEGNSADREGLH